MKEYLILWSGGKDSFLSTCRLVTNGGKAILLSFNSGSEIGEINLLHGVRRLQRRYGEDRVEYAGIYPIVAIIRILNKHWIYMTQKELGEKWPNLTNCQFQCLHCQTAMWIAAMAYAKAKNIKYIASGYKKTDTFCTGIEQYLKTIQEEAKSLGLEIIYPVWDIENDYERDSEIYMHQFIPKVLEPKCLIGRPTINGLLKDEEYDIIAYFNEILKPELRNNVEKLIPIFSSLKLSEHSWELINIDDYKIPNEPYY